MSFTSTNVVTELDDQIAQLAFQGPDDGYLVVSRTLKPRAQDLKLGHDKVYVEFNDQGWACYGGIVSARLGQREFSLRLDPKIAKRLETDQIKIELEIDSESWGALKDAAAVIFAGDPAYTLLDNPARRARGP